MLLRTKDYSSAVHSYLCRSISSSNTGIRIDFFWPYSLYTFAYLHWYLYIIAAKWFSLNIMPSYFYFVSFTFLKKN
jgi:hypothetical protein